MVKMRVLGTTVALTVLVAACSGGGSEPAGQAGEASATEDISTQEAPADEAANDPASDQTAASDDPMATKDGVDYASLTGDAAKGKQVFAQCRTCHVMDEGMNRTGPSLAGIIGRKAGSVEGFKYSPANAESGVTWTEEQMYVYLEDPQRSIPKTKMIFAGLPKAQDRADVIAYMKDPS